MRMTSVLPSVTSLLQHPLISSSSPKSQSFSCRQWCWLVGPLVDCCQKGSHSGWTVQRLQDCHQRWSRWRTVCLPPPCSCPGWTHHEMAPWLMPVTWHWLSCGHLLSSVRLRLEQVEVRKLVNKMHSTTNVNHVVLEHERPAKTELEHLVQYVYTHTQSCNHPLLLVGEGGGKEVT